VNKKDDNACDYGAFSGYNFFLSALITCFLLHVIVSAILTGLKIKTWHYVKIFYWFWAGNLVALSFNLISNIFNESNCGF
jgi:hypothetical protein